METIPLEPLENPPLLPGFVACYSARLAAGDHRLHFRAGRECAARAMSRLGAPPDDIPRGVQGAPVWPAGLTGSITHKHEYVSAAVARTSDVRGLGIDAEDLISPERSARIGRMVMLPQESSVGGSIVADADRVILVFSIKEAVYKCLHPLVRRRFYYDAIAVTDIDLERRRFDAVLLVDLAGGFAAGYSLSGGVVIVDRRVHAAAWIAADPAARGTDRNVPTV